MATNVDHRVQETEGRIPVEGYGSVSRTDYEAAMAIIAHESNVLGLDETATESDYIHAALGLFYAGYKVRHISINAATEA